MTGCEMCGGLGWVLECNDLGKPGPRMAEFIPCLLPDCEESGQSVQRVSFKGIQFSEVSRHPATGYVTAVGIGPTAPEVPS